MIEGRLMQNRELTIIFDNEPRNKEICKQIDRSINQGQRMVIWPKSVVQKDINDMILSGMTKEEIEKIIKENTFSGVEAKLKFSEWRKTNV